jgi:hypothetical protein
MLIINILNYHVLPTSQTLDFQAFGGNDFFAMGQDKTTKTACFATCRQLS